MSLWILLATAAAGGLGAGARYTIDALIMRGRTEAFPLGIFLVNVIGSFTLGLLTGLAAFIGSEVLTIVGTGLLGGFTTFSAVSADSAVLAERGRRPWMWANLAGTLLICVIAAALGLAIARTFA